MKIKKLFLAIFALIGNSFCDNNYSMREGEIELINNTPYSLRISATPEPSAPIAISLNKSKSQSSIIKSGEKAKYDLSTVPGDFNYLRAMYCGDPDCKTQESAKELAIGSGVPTTPIIDDCNNPNGCHSNAVELTKNKTYTAIFSNNKLEIK